MQCADDRKALMYSDAFNLVLEIRKRQNREKGWVLCPASRYHLKRHFSKVFLETRVVIDGVSCMCVSDWAVDVQTTGDNLLKNRKCVYILIYS